MTESVTEAVNRVLKTVNEETLAMRQATEASRNAVFGLLGIITGRMQQCEDRIANLEQRLQAIVEGKMSEVAADTFNDMIENIDIFINNRGNK